MWRNRWCKTRRNEWLSSRKRTSPSGDRQFLAVEPLEARNLLSFLPALNYPVSPFTQETAIGSFCGDGIADLAVTNINNPTVNVLLGNGDGTFRSTSFQTGGRNAEGIVAGQFRTGTGILDLAVADRAGNSIRIVRGTGACTFQGVTTVTGSFSAPTDITEGDFNGDGNLDLAVTNQGNRTVSVLLGNGDGTFRLFRTYSLSSSTFSNVGFLGTADLGGNGVLDLVVTPLPGSTVAVLRGNGDGTFQNPDYIPAGDPAKVAIGEFRAGSGILDLAVTNRTENSVSVLLGNRDGSFQAPVTYPIGNDSQFPDVAVGDFNQDGNLDLVATNFGANTVSVLLGNGDGTFRAPMSFGIGSNPDTVRVGDFNGDGYPDLVVNNFGSSSVSVLRNDANWGIRPASFQVAAPPKVQGGTPFSITVTAVDTQGNVVPGYTGTVHFSTSDPDPGVVLPADYTFTAADGGVHTFSDTGLGETTLRTRGYQSVTVTDTADGSIVGSATLKVKHLRHHENGSPGAPAGQDLAAADRVFAALVPEDFGLLSSPQQRRRESGGSWWLEMADGQDLSPA